ncbi:MAG TPA: protein kinase [Kofleriaceae bacterium]|nr:protein kinase [Kofleriaceae bacterium]
MLGQYILRELIGEGGYGAVYRGEQPALERDVVVKVLHEQRSDSESRERFLREAKLAAQLDHPYAAHVYAFGAEDEGRLLWIAMERVRGVPLDVWLDEHGPMSPEQFGPFFEGLCEVIHAAHKQGIIHRDLKPPNIMVVECGGRLLPKLLDFGIAKWHRPPEAALAPGSGDDRDLDRGAVKTERLPIRPRRAGRTVACHDSESRRQLTPPGGCLGSPPYMALEQWVGADAVGPEADIYALAIIAYEMLTARRLFVANQTAEYLEHHKRASAPPLGDGFPPALDRVIQCALDKDPRARPATALELASDLRTALRKIKREQLRASAQQWSDQAAAPGLLWGADVLEETLRSVPRQTLSLLERSFVAASQRRIRRLRWVRRALVSLAAMVAIVGMLYRAAMQTQLAQEQARSARELAEARVTDSELEQGRSALLHGEPDAQLHLSRAYQRGDHSPSTAFMLARSIQPRLSEQARFTSTHGRMWWATFSPDGRQIVTAGDRDVRIWDARTFQPILTLPHGADVYQALYSPDGTRLVTVTETTLKIWDARSGALSSSLTAKHSTRAADYFLATLSPDGSLVAATDPEGSTVRVWDTTSREQVAELRNRATSPVLAFSGNGWLATTGADGAYVFDVRTWRRVLTIPVSAHSLAFDTHGRLVTGAATGDVALWDIPSGARVRQLRQSGEPVEAVAFSSGGELVAAGSRDGTIQVWQVSSGALRSQLNPRSSKVLAVEFDPSSASLLAANADGTVVIVDVAQGLPISVLDGPSNAVRTAHFDPSGRRVVGASRDGTARVWEATSPYRRSTSEPMGDDCGVFTRAEIAGHVVVISCRDRPTRVWDTVQGRQLAELPSANPIEGSFASAVPVVSGGGDRVAIARGSVVQMYELPGGQLLRTIDHPAAVSAVAFALTGRDLVSGAVDGSVRVTRDDGAELTLHASSGVDAVGLLPDGRVIVSDAGRRLHVYGPGGTVQANLEVPGRLMALRYQGAHLVALPSYAGDATPPVVIDLDRYRVAAQLAGHIGQVFSARWVAGERVLTAGADGTARLWDAATGQLLLTYRGGSRFLVDATITEGLVIGGDADGLLRFWDAETGAKLWTLKAHKSAVIRIHVQDGDLVTRGYAGEISRWQLPQPAQVIAACSRHPPCAIVP